ncbi:LRR and NB-ARC domains-containing disease resistance protein [Dorcoceras hygrometricum]|uniref:LRR and NB-ARC domains-containing disease resistance protein n=1 Tax=Dorcoceras hygrometricum TaxID=472368 RepID=A0A2Z7CS44_9LAMI|nr:LRR and NB-ARC domains-containing disease resistance protein [Dorcoceras hygrometricum]
MNSTWLGKSLPETFVTNQKVGTDLTEFFLSRIAVITSRVRKVCIRGMSWVRSIGAKLEGNCLDESSAMSNHQVWVSAQYNPRNMRGHVGSSVLGDELDVVVAGALTDVGSAGALLVPCIAHTLTISPRGPSSSRQSRTYADKLERLPEDALSRSGSCPKTRSEIGFCPRPHYHFVSVSREPCLDVMKSPAQTSRRSNYSPPVPDTPELLDVVMLARRMR